MPQKCLPGLEPQNSYVLGEISIFQRVLNFFIIFFFIIGNIADPNYTSFVAMIFVAVIPEAANKITEGQVQVKPII
jgi:hypothetical protein